MHKDFETRVLPPPLVCTISPTSTNAFSVPLHLHSTKKTLASYLDLHRRTLGEGSSSWYSLGLPGPPSWPISLFPLHLVIFLSTLVVFSIFVPSSTQNIGFCFFQSALANPNIFHVAPPTFSRLIFCPDAFSYNSRIFMIGSTLSQ